MHTCNHTYIHANMHTCIHTYIHAYIHTYMFSTVREWYTECAYRAWSICNLLATPTHTHTHTLSLKSAIFSPSCSSTPPPHAPVYVYSAPTETTGHERSQPAAFYPPPVSARDLFPNQTLLRPPGRAVERKRERVCVCVCVCGGRMVLSEA
jgi:hypothetical protein